MRIRGLLKKVKLYLAKQQLRPFIITIIITIFACAANANPVGGNVTSGNVTIQQTPGSTVINQSSPQAIINWQSFNIGSGEVTHFQQPAGGITLNRISADQGASQIYGSLTATGQIILINPAGIYFGPSAHVNVGGLIASTADISDADFLKGNYHFTPVPGYNGSIINAGTIIAADHGLIALIGNNVTNTGMIQANVGHVILASGNAFTISFAGNDLINFSVDSKTSGGVDQNGVELRDGVNNTGSIIADGGTVLVTAQAAQGVLDHVINMEGVVQARSVGVQNGEIILNGGDQGLVRIAGKLDASGRNAGEKGGNITVIGKQIFADANSFFDVSGDIGGGNILIGGNYHGAGSLPNASATVIAPTAKILADAITSGNGGQVIVWSQDATGAYGIISAKGGALSGNGGFVETSSHNYLDVSGISVNTSATNGTSGTWLLDPADVTISNGADNQTLFTGTSYTPNPSTVSTSNINVAGLEANLATTGINIVTTSTGAGTGNITVVDPITWASSHGLTLTPDTAGQIFLNASITPTSGGGVFFNGPTVVGANVTVGSNTAGFILFNSINDAVAGTHSLIISSGSALKVIQKDVGDTAPLASLTMNGGSDTFLSANSFATTGNQVYADHIFIAPPSGTTQLISSAGDIQISGAVDTTGAPPNRNLYVSNAGAGSFISGVINNIANFTKDGAGTLILSNANTYTGQTTINNGVLKLGNSNGIPSASLLTINAAGTFNLNGFVASVGGFAGSGNLILGNSGILTSDTGTNIFSGTITGGAASLLFKQGFGTLILTHDNSATFTGNTNIASGTLEITNANALGNNAITINGSGAVIPIFEIATGGASTLPNSSITFTNAGSLVVAGNTDASITGSITLSAGTTSFVASTASDTIRFNGVINGTSSAALSLSGSGTIVFNAALGNASQFASLTSNVSALNVNANITTAGSQVYNTSVTFPAAAITLTAQGSGTQEIDLNQGATGGNDLTLAGGSSGTYTFNIADSLSLNSITASAANSGANTLKLSVNSNPSIVLTGINTGGITTTGVTNNISFSNMANLTYAGSGSSILTLSPGGTLTGTFNGGGKSILNTSSLNGSTNAVASAGSGLTITGLISASGVSGAIANSAFTNTLTVAKNNSTIIINGAGSGIISDPLVFSNFTNLINAGTNNTIIFNTSANISSSTTAVVNGVPMTFTGFNLFFVPDRVNVAAIVGQPTSTSYVEEADLSSLTAGVGADIANMTNMINQYYARYLTGLTLVNCNQ